MTELKPNREISFRFVFSIAIPIFFESVLRILLGNVDQWMVSRYSDTAVAAIGNANQVINMGIIVLDMVCLATAILLSQYVGAGETKNTARLYTLSLAMVGLLSLLLSGVLLLFGKHFFTWMQIPPELLPEARLYLGIAGGTLCLQGFFMGISAVLRSHAMMKEIMLVSIVMNLVNVAGNFLLINGYGALPRLGVAGAAISTAFSRLAGVALLFYFLKKRLGLRLDFAVLRHPDFAVIRRVFRVGLPAAGDSISYNCMQMVLLSIVNTYGTMAVTAKVYLGSLLPFVYLVASAFAAATQISVGYLVGAGQPDKTTQLIKRSISVSLCVSLSLSIALWASSDGVFGIFTSDTATLALVKQVLAVDIFVEIGRAVNMTMIRSLLAAGDTSFPLYCGLASMWGVSVPLGYLLGTIFGMGLAGIWIGMAADEWCRAAAFLLRWRSGKWRDHRLV